MRPSNALRVTLARAACSAALCNDGWMRRAKMCDGRVVLITYLYVLVDVGAQEGPAVHPRAEQGVDGRGARANVEAAHCQEGKPG